MRDDQRVFERFRAKFPVKFKDTRDEYGTNIFLKNASAEGVCVDCLQRLFLNDYVSLDVKLPDGFDPLILNGRVVWIKTVEPSKRWEAGIRFNKIDLMKLNRLFRLVEPAGPRQALEGFPLPLWPFNILP